MPDPAHILLIGLRGAGKSAAGRLAATRLQRDFLDLDEVTPALAGCPSVAEAWALWGQRAFRNAEARALTGLLFDGSWRGRGVTAVLPRQTVTALGGGTPTAPGAEQAIRESVASGRAAVLYLRAAPGVLRARLGTADNRDRPALTADAGGDPLREIEAVFEARDPCYRALAGEAGLIETEALDEAGAADRIVSRFRA